MKQWRCRNSADGVAYRGAQAGGAMARAPQQAPVAAEAPWTDPYYRWAVASGWRGFARIGGWDRAGALDLRGAAQATAEARDPAQPADADTAAAPAIAYGEAEISIFAQARTTQSLRQVRRLASADEAWLHVAKAYLQPATPHRFFTAKLKVRDLDRLARELPDVRWELAVPVRDPTTRFRAAAEGFYGPTRDAMSFKARNRLHSVEQSEPVKRGSIEGNVIAVIDFGCPFLNTRFAGAAGQGTRIAALWDQSDHPGVGIDAAGGGGPGPMSRDAQPFVDLPWTRPEAFKHGRELSGDALSKMCDEVRSAGAAFNEAAAYAGINYLLSYEDPRRRVYFATHGAHVLDMAGGCHDPLTDASDDAASQAKLVFVQLPGLTVADSSGGSLSAHLLDAVRYILYVCHPDARIAINISYGSFAGPHDGLSMIERALDEVLSLRRDNLAIVLAAGNAHEAACHVRREVRDQRSALLRWRLVSADTTDTFVEVWYRPPRDESILRVRTRRADEAWGPWLAPGESAQLDEIGSGEPVGMVCHDRVAPGSRKAMILVATRPTATPAEDDGPLMEAGEWEMELALWNSTKSSKVVVDGWVERDDPNDYSGRMQSCFVALAAGDADECLSSIATGEHTIVVGAYRIGSGQPTPYSSVGTRRDGIPLYYAASEIDDTEQGINAAAVASFDIQKMNGTSVAAPVMTRRLLNAMGAPGAPGVERAQWRAVIERLIDERPATDPGTHFIQRAPPKADD